YQKWVEAFARNRNIPIEWAEKGVRKEDYVQPWLRKMVGKNAYGVYSARMLRYQPPLIATRCRPTTRGCGPANRSFHGTLPYEVVQPHATTASHALRVGC